jgi:hypothetical protein
MTDDCHIVVANADPLTTEGLLEQVPGGRFHIMRREDFDGKDFEGKIAIIDHTESALAWLKSKIEQNLLPPEISIYCLHFADDLYEEIEGVVHCGPKDLLKAVAHDT